MIGPEYPKSEEKEDPNIERERHLNELKRDHEREASHDAKEEYKEHCNDCD